MKSGLRVSHKGGLQKRSIVKIKAHRGDVGKKIHAHRRIMMADDGEGYLDRRNVSTLSSRGRVNGPVKVSGTTVDGFRFLGVSEFPSNAVKYSGVVVDVGGLAKGVYNLSNGYSLRVEDGESRLVQIVGIDPKNKVLNAKRITNGFVRYELETIANGYELKPIKPRAEVR